MLHSYMKPIQATPNIFVAAHPGISTLMLQILLSGPQVNDLINNPPDPSQSEGLGGLQALMGGHGASLQNLLAGGNPQLLEQLMTSGALSPLQSGGLFDGAG